MAPPIAQQVLIAVSGATSSGICAALGLEHTGGAPVSVHELTLPGIDEGCAPLIQAGPRIPKAPALLINFGDTSSPSLSALVLNFCPVPSRSTRLAHAAVSLLPTGCTVGLVASLPRLGSANGGLRVAMLGGMEVPPLGIAQAEPSAKVTDPLVAALIHFLVASQLPACCLLLVSPGEVASSGNSKQTASEVQMLGEAAAAIFPGASLRFSPELAASCRKGQQLRGGSKGRDLAGGDLMYI